MKLPSFLSLWSPLQPFDWLICKWGYSLKSTSPRCVHKINVLILIAFSVVFINIFGLVWFLTFDQAMFILLHHRILLHTFSPCLIIYIWQLNDKYEKLIGKHLHWQYTVSSIKRKLYGVLNKHYVKIDPFMIDMPFFERKKKFMSPYTFWIHY